MDLSLQIDPKTLRETLCVAQSMASFIPLDVNVERYMNHLQLLINECDRHRPLGPDGKHGNRHTKTCGCEDKGHGVWCPQLLVGGDFEFREEYVCEHLDNPWPVVRYHNEWGTGERVYRVINSPNAEEIAKRLHAQWKQFKDGPSGLSQEELVAREKAFWAGLEEEGLVPEGTADNWAKSAE